MTAVPLPSPPLMPEERQQVILTRLAAGSRVLAADLAREFGTSEDTIRRDMRELAGAGRCRRVYGGVLPLAPAPRPLAEREGEATARKDALAWVAAGLVVPGQTLIIDAGSTNAAIARALPTGLGITVVTNAPAIATTLLDRPGIAVVMIGGPVDRTIGGSIGARAVRDLALLRADLCFLGTCALDAEAGAAVFCFEDADFKRAVVAASTAVAIAVTSDKLGTTAPHIILDARAVTHLIVEADADPAALAGFDRTTTHIHSAGVAHA
ncbi:MAG: DeoR/GlpR family DNA-binding transcription regulator [Azospirillaceae bacterium]|nr:DeoR/GlpR family DNA-binding transcription regulator [Azospirillaceae bacterium]